MEVPHHFKCPISLEVMKDPVTISTGVTYERKNIEKWLFTYKKKLCPATMQILQTFDLTPNNTLKRLIGSWQEQQSKSPYSPPPSLKHDELVSLMIRIESTPFKVSSLKKLRAVIENGDDQVKVDFIHSGGIDVLSRIMVQILIENTDNFVTFRACEEALGVLYHLIPLSDEGSIELLSKPECMKSIATMLQHGSAEARMHAVTIFRNISRVEYYNWDWIVQEQGIDLFKSLLELLSDEICAKASSSALDVLIEILGASKKSRLKALEAGAICILIELLPDSNRSKCEKILLLIKLLCETADGRLALVDHSLGIAAVSKMILRVSDVATKIGIKILWLICSVHPIDKVIEDMLMFGAVKKLIGLLHIGGRSSSSKDKALKILKLHGDLWRQYPCSPSELRDYLKLKANS
ncbi:hypothetical protein Scep_026851 [Stephania cephalantha]|uniref:U-box domain-containing protein n=1 Tax=Stephania cephalantha TaxID=152367 RepID=A0AAP0HSE3_9MAGN